MGQEPEALRADIERRRDDMSDTIDAIGDRVIPGRIVDRRKRAVGEWVGNVRERVMGPAQSMTQRTSSAMGTVGDDMSKAADKIGDAPQQLTRATAGSPLLAGAVAFGLGALVAALLPETETEQHAARAIQPQMEAVTSAVKDAGQHAMETAKSSAQDAAQDLKESAAEHASEVTEQAKEAGSDVAGTAREAAKSPR
jgi:hypothetical protein